VNLLKSDALTKDMIAKLDDSIPMSAIDAKKQQDSKKKHSDKLLGQKIDLNYSSQLFVDPLTQEEFIFRVNYRYFMNEFRTRMIVGIFLNRTSGQAAVMMEALLSENKLHGKSTAFKTTDPLSLSDIMRKVAHIPTLQEVVVTKALENLEKEGFVKRILSKDSLHPGSSYTTNLDALIKTLQLKTIEKTVETRFSQYHARILRILNKFGYLDEKQISEKGMIPLKEARSAILDMVKERIVVSQELIGEKGKHIFVFALKISEVLDNVVTEYYKVISNMKSREEKELDDIEELRNTTNNDDKINELISHVRKIESAILEVDNSLMLFTEF